MQSTLLLKTNQCLTVKADQVFVTSGVVWLTQSGYSKDVILHAGQSYQSRGSGKIVVLACSDNTGLSLHSTSLISRVHRLVLALLKEIRLHSRDERHHEGRLESNS